MMNDKTKIFYSCGLLIFCIGLYSLLIPLLHNYNYFNVKISSFIIYLLDKDIGGNHIYKDMASFMQINSCLQLSGILSLLAIISGLLLIYLSNHSNDSMTKKCLNCGISFTINTNRCPKCGANIRGMKKYVGMCFRLIVIAMAMIGGYLEANVWQQFALPDGSPYVWRSGWWFLLKYSIIYGVIFLIILIIIPKIYSFFRNQNRGKS